MTKEEMKKRREDADKRFREQCESLANIDLYSATVRMFHVYLGSFDELVNISNELNYHVDKPEEFGGDEVIHIKLKEIYEQVKEKYGHDITFGAQIGRVFVPMITVFDESPMRSKIYQCGNYGDGLWVKLGEIQGYA